MFLYIIKLNIRVKNRKGDMQGNREQVRCRGRSRGPKSFHSSILLLLLLLLLRAFAVLLSLAVSSQPPGKKTKESAQFDDLLAARCRIDLLASVCACGW